MKEMEKLRLAAVKQRPWNAVYMATAVGKAVGKKEMRQADNIEL